MKTQKGFAVVEGLLILVIAGLIGFTGWYVWSARSNANKTLENASAIKISAPSNSKKPTNTSTDLQKYVNEDGGFTLEYPKNWTVKSDKSAIMGPSGATLNIKVVTQGGFGFCEGGGCPALEYKTVEDTGQKATVSSDNGNDTQYTEVPLNLVTLTETGSGRTTYYVGLTSREDAQSSINKTQEGVGAGFGDFLFTAAGSKTGYPLIAIYSSSNSSDFLSSSDAGTIKEILKSFKYGN